MDPALYESPRFYWAPVAVTAYASNTAGDYPILGFRPVFLTPDASSQISTPIDTLVLNLVTQAAASGYSLVAVVASLGASAGCLAMPATCDLISLLERNDISSALNALASGTTTTGGLVIDGNQKVRAARFMTLAPGALQAVPQDYDGPTTDYLGVGPKIIRLTK